MMSHQWRQRSWTYQEERLKRTIKLNICKICHSALGCWVRDTRGHSPAHPPIQCPLVSEFRVVARNKEIVKNKSVHELSQIRDISDFPVPDGVENFFKHKQQAVADNEKM